LPNVFYFCISIIITLHLMRGKGSYYFIDFMYPCGFLKKE
jgi:hypothetical protein